MSLTEAQKQYLKEYKKRPIWNNPKSRNKRRTYHRIYSFKRRRLAGIPERHAQYPQYSGLSPKERLRQVRIDVLKNYGGDPPKCACCAEIEVKFLSIDHINGEWRWK